VTLAEAYALWRDNPTEESKQAVLEALAEAVELRDRLRERENGKKEM
jgi:hypothetical protein